MCVTHMTLQTQYNFKKYENEKRIKRKNEAFSLEKKNSAVKIWTQFYNLLLPNTPIFRMVVLSTSFHPKVKQVRGINAN